MKKRYFLIAAVILASFGAWRIYVNNQTSVGKVKEILTADQAGTDVSLQTASLNTYVLGHMGSSVKYELTGSYDRAVKAAQDGAQPDVSGALYQEATTACATKDPVAQAACIQNYVSARPAATTAPVKLPDRNSYQHQLTAPGWTPDVAGGSLLAAATLVLLTGWFAVVEKLAKRH